MRETIYTLRINFKIRNNPKSFEVQSIEEIVDYQMEILGFKKVWIYIMWQEHWLGVSAKDATGLKLYFGPQWNY